jgi:hypothetical protein
VSLIFVRQGHNRWLRQELGSEFWSRVTWGGK